MSLPQQRHMCATLARIIQVGCFCLQAAGERSPTFHAVSYCNTVDSKMTLSLGTAELHGLYPIVVGLGSNASWAYGLSSLANAFRDYVFHRTETDDIVLFFDATDVVFQGGEQEIVNGYLELEKLTGRELIYHAEKSCTSARKNEYPQVASPWRYLNCGLYIGRSRAIRNLFRDPLPSPLVDRAGNPMRLQNWHTDYFLDNQDKSALDSNCTLMQVVDNIEGLQSEEFYPHAKGLKLVNGKLHNTLTGTVPIILHFPGSGHWPDRQHPLRTGTCPIYEFFRAAGHPGFAKLLEAEVRKKSFFGQRPWKKFCSEQVYFFDKMAMRLVFVGDYVFWAVHTLGRWQLFLVIVLPLLVILVVLRKTLRALTSLKSHTKST